MKRFMGLFSFALFSNVACATGQQAESPAVSSNPPPGYPADWWKPVPESERASWEILPQDAKDGEVIVSKRTELGAFSNLADFVIDFESVRYGSVEGLWQGMKYPEEDPRDPRRASGDWPFTRAQVLGLAGFEAKHAGDAANAINKELGIKWISYKGERFEPKDKGAGTARHFDLITRITEAKIAQHPQLRELLLKTRGLKLRMDHKIPVTDGPSYQTPEILMKIRAELE